MPSTATFAFLANASIFLASARFLPTGYDSSSVVLTIGILRLEHGLDLRHHLLERRVGAQDDDVGLLALQRARRVAA